MSEKLKPCPFCGVDFEISKNIIAHPREGDCIMLGLGWNNSKVDIDRINARASDIKALANELKEAEVLLLRIFKSYADKNLSFDDDWYGEADWFFNDINFNAQPPKEK